MARRLARRPENRNPNDPKNIGASDSPICFDRNP